MPEKKTVLLVDDECGNETSGAEQVTWLIRRKGYAVLVAKNPQTALSILATQKVDVVLADIYFKPGDKPVETLVHYCQKNQVGIAFLTGATSSIKTQYEKAVEVITKPAHIEEILLELYKTSRIYDPSVPVKKTILIVEEDYTCTGSIRNILLDEGYNIVIVKNKDDMLNTLNRNEHVDLVISGADYRKYGEIIDKFSNLGTPFVFMDDAVPKLGAFNKSQVFTIERKDAQDPRSRRWLEAVKKADAAGDKKQRKKTLLYIEDDDDVRGIMTENLSTGQYTVKTASSLGIAKASVDLSQIDVILTDVRLTGSSEEKVFEFLKHCRDIGIELIFMSGAIAEAKDTAEKSGITGARFLKKPVTFSSMMKSIDEAMERAKDWSQHKVLIFEDDPKISRYIIDELESHGFQTQVVKTMAEARAIIQKEKISAISSDIFYNQHKNPSDEYLAFVKECLAKGIVVTLFTGANYFQQPSIDGIKIIEKPAPYYEITFAIKQGIIERLGNPQQVSDEELHHMCNPEWHLSSPTVKWISKILENPNSSRAEREIALLTLDESRIKKELQESAKHGEWSKRELNELIDNYRATLEKLSGLKNKLYGTPMPDILRVKRRQTI